MGPSGRVTQKLSLRLTRFVYTSVIPVARSLALGWYGSGSGLRNLLKDSSPLGQNNEIKKCHDMLYDENMRYDMCAIASVCHPLGLYL